MRSSTIRRVARAVAASSLVASAFIESLIACKGGSGPLPDEREPTASGTSVTDILGSSPTTSASTDTCRAVETDALSCGEYSVALAVDKTACHFNEDGAGAPELCAKLCANTRVTSCRRAGDETVKCTAPCDADGL